MAKQLSYIKPRPDLLAMIDRPVSSALDVGCAEGTNGAELKSKFGATTVTGIELDPEMALLAKSRIDEVLVGDAAVELERLATRGYVFDLVVLGDILEHLIDPWSALRVVRRLCPRGIVLVSLPNVAHCSTVFSLVVGRHWPYRDRGIHDRTHLRFFARRNLEELFEGAGFRISELEARYRVTDTPSIMNDIAERAIKRLPIFRGPFVYQFLCRLT